MMGFVEIEDKGKKILEQFPILKKASKRMYQLVSYSLSKKTKYEGNLIKITPDDEYEYFYGYYDKSPWDSENRYVIALKALKTYKEVAPKESAEIILIDTFKDNKVIKIATTHSWNVQQACMAQWLGPDFHSKIIYNDFRNNKYCSVIFNVEKMIEEKELPLPIYDVSKDGTFALSLDFSRLHRLRPGYGYSNIEDKTKKELCPEKTCIWKMDLETGNIIELFKYTDFANFEKDETMEGAEHKVNHLMISPNGKRFMVLHRWFKNKRKHTRLITVNIDGTEMYNLSDDVFVSHCFWKNDEEILSFLRKKKTGNHYYLMKDRTQEYRLYWDRLAVDGHCSYSPDKTLVITDSYPNRKRMAFVYVCAEWQQQPVRIAKVFSPFKYDNECRCDLHPRWNRNGTAICIDSVHEGKRGIYVIPITNKDIPEKSKKEPDRTKGKYKIVYVITNCKNSGPMNQTLNIIKNLDRNTYEPIIVTLFLEDLGNSVIQRFMDEVAEIHCLKLSKIQSILSGKKKLKALLEEIKPDLIQGLGMPPYTMSLAYKNAVHLVTLRNYCYEDYPDKYGKTLGRILAIKDMHLIKKQVRNGESFVTCSKSLSNIYKEKEKLHIEFIQNGVDVEKYKTVEETEKQKMREKLNLPKDKIIAIYTGQIIDRKDQQSAIEGIINSGNKEIVLLLLGDGKNKENLEQRYKNYSNIIFKGNVNNVVEYLQASDFYISTSKSEGMPNGVLEAMACGLPVLLSDIPQHKEILETNSNIGQMYKLNDLESLKNSIKEIVNKDLKEIGKESYSCVINNFTSDVMSKKYQKLYHELINK